MGQIRKRIKHQTTFEERLAEEARLFKEAAEKQRPGSKSSRIAFAPGATSRNSFTHERLAVIAGACVAQMNEYRAYLMGPDGHIKSRVDLICEHEEAAKEQAKQLVDGHDVELWQLDRKIATFIRKQ